jgi:hypothetical protein
MCSKDLFLLKKALEAKPANRSGPLLILRIVETEANRVASIILFSRARLASIEVEVTACIEMAVLNTKAASETARAIQFEEAMTRQVLFVVLANQRKLRNPKAAKTMMVPSTSVVKATVPSLLLICLRLRDIEVLYPCFADCSVALSGRRFVSRGSEFRLPGAPWWPDSAGGGGRRIRKIGGDLDDKDSVMSFSKATSPPVPWNVVTVGVAVIAVTVKNYALSVWWSSNAQKIISSVVSV